MRRTPRWATQAACSPRSLRPYATWRSCARKYTRTRYRGRIPPIKTLCGHEDPPLGLQLDPWCDVFPFRSFSLSLSLCVSIPLFSVSLFLCLSLSLSLSCLCLCLSFSLSESPSPSLSMAFALSLSFCRPLCVCLSVYLSLSVCPSLSVLPS